MSRAELIDDKKELFARPKSVRAVLNGRDPIFVNRREDVLEAAQNRGKRPLVLSGFDLVPEDFYSAVNFAKRGPLVELETFRGDVAQLKAHKQSDLKARIAASEEYQKRNEPYVGWAWVDPEKRHHVLRPTTVVEGHRLHVHALLARSIEDKIEVGKSYRAKDAPSHTIPVRVPSRSGKDKHDILVHNITSASDPEKYVEWTRLDADHSCPHKAWDRVTFRFADKGGIVNYCPHIVAAQIALSRRIMEESPVGSRGSKEPIPQPFPMITEPYARLETTLLYHTIKVDTFMKDGRLHTHSRPLTMPEADNVLMEAWLTHGNRHTLFVESPHKQYRRGLPASERKTIRQYNWSTDAPGMPFRTD